MTNRNGKKPTNYVISLKSAGILLLFDLHFLMINSLHSFNSVIFVLICQIQFICTSCRLL